MFYVIICVSAFLASALTLFSGFGLGTLLLPVFSIFFPVQTAVALTAVVHFLNNLFKLALLGKHADRIIVVQFGLPALAAAFLGAEALVWMSDLRPLLSYQAFGQEFRVVPVKLVVAVLMVVFALLELVPAFERLQFGRKVLPFGGVITGFFGGLSGHQGALRSAFLLKAVPSKESIIGTGVAIACIVDGSRLLVYSSQFSSAAFERLDLLTAATVAALTGALVASRLVAKVKLRMIQVLVAIMLIGIAMGLGSGLL